TFLLVLQNAAGVADGRARAIDLRFHGLDLVRLVVQLHRIAVGFIGAAFDNQLENGNLFEKPQIALSIAPDSLQCIFKKTSEGVCFLHGEKLGVHAELDSLRRPGVAKTLFPDLALSVPDDLITSSDV